jgi:hypothetical protein
MFGLVSVAVPTTKPCDDMVKQEYTVEFVRSKVGEVEVEWKMDG